jgi:O-antigen/teichoic acid export membrane protein
VSLINRLLGSKLINDSFWSLFGNVIFRGLFLISGIIIARFLGKDIFGEYGIIKSTIISIATFSTFGFGYTATKYVSEFKNNNPDKLKSIIYYSTKITLFVSSVVAILLFLSASYVAETILGAKHLNVSLRILAILVVFNSLTTLQVGILSGYGKFKEMAFVNFFVGATMFVLSVVLTYLYDLNGALIALLITQILNWGLHFRIVNKNIPDNILSFNKDNEFLKEVIKFSVPVALQEVLYSAMFWLSSFLLVKHSSYGELGLYNASMQWNAIILFIPGILRNVVLSHLSEVQNDRPQHTRVMRITLTINFLMTFIPAILVLLMSGFIARIYGASFEGLSKLIGVAVFSTIFVSISNVYAQAYMSKGMNWMMFAFRFVRDVGSILLFLIFLKYFNTGAIAMIYSSLVFNAVFMVIMVVYYNLNINNERKE